MTSDRVHTCNLSPYVLLFNSLTECSPGEFACVKGACLDISLWCDGAYDCLDNSDEPPNCDTSKSRDEPPNCDTSKSRDQPPNCDTSKSRDEPPNCDTSKSRDEPPNCDTSKSRDEPPNCDTSKSRDEPPNCDTSHVMNHQTVIQVT